jgi:ankyrin repeat protein
MARLPRLIQRPIVEEKTKQYNDKALEAVKDLDAIRLQSVIDDAKKDNIKISLIGKKDVLGGKDVLSYVLTRSRGDIMSLVKLLGLKVDEDEYIATFISHLGETYVTMEYLQGNNPFHIAVINGYGSKVIKALYNLALNISKKAKADNLLNERDAYESSTPLIKAACATNMSAIYTMLELGADHTITDRYGRYFIYRLILAMGKDIDKHHLDELDRRYNISVRELDIHHRNLVHVAVESLINGINNLWDFFKRNVDTYVPLINLKDDKQQTPIFTAVRLNRLDITRFLIDHGASLTLTDINGNSPLHYATSADMIKTLVSKGADISLVNGRGLTPIQTIAETRILDPSRREIMDLLELYVKEYDVVPSREIQCYLGYDERTRLVDLYKRQHTMQEPRWKTYIRNPSANRDQLLEGINFVGGMELFSTYTKGKDDNERLANFYKEHFESLVKTYVDIWKTKFNCENEDTFVGYPLYIFTDEQLLVTKTKTKFGDVNYCYTYDELENYIRQNESADKWPYGEKILTREDRENIIKGYETLKSKGKLNEKNILGKLLEEAVSASLLSVTNNNEAYALAIGILVSADHMTVERVLTTDNLRKLLIDNLINRLKNRNVLADELRAFRERALYEAFPYIYRAMKAVMDLGLWRATDIASNITTIAYYATLSTMINENEGVILLHQLMEESLQSLQQSQQ